MITAHYSDEIGLGSNHKATWFYSRSKSQTILVCMHGMLGWMPGLLCDAVMDDFGNLVKVA
ncbi:MULTISPECIES: hypothetical protein [unclassified Achromobacter]|uniref:hypothetical protein n=1 Tax=unclassified Achromobacter TaxID=2626865 RepID=UPI000B51C7A1|nr:MULTISPECIES: hypothetical protein [unclassified Achromobacter]OWT68064.1 hypothetical protein CEY05_28945 [Achromobacter sp. HZ34]OWT69901.1 hypothetical protein CEY04_27775 [Achromobacter sp. HZ28]